ncbi:hypothetical protein EJ08DRAFT_638494 [Tothia fuscella]|uniref:Urease accessory protein n=1 Tax=Tothia fuscella TaxID=1048955 RepID=A0A9P4NL33_9PEZI|nr:hypothetical protein EJ08DRAFT_638494 [Tothia fuscella]
MPHKHKRQKTSGAKGQDFDLAPQHVAKSLSVTKIPRGESVSSKPPSKPSITRKSDFQASTSTASRNVIRKKSKDSGRKDDTPKAFARLMQLRDTGKGINSLDNGDARAGNKKRKRGPQETAVESMPKEVKEQTSRPMILPGERLADFAARVNQALPVSGLARKAKQVDGVKERQTKHEKKLQKLVNGWKEEEARRIAKAEGDRDIADEDMEAEKTIWEDRNAELMRGKKGKRIEIDDPWAELKGKRKEATSINDIVQAPPQFSTIPKNTFKVKEGTKTDNVPAASGSQKRREELGETRLGLIERYREMMKEKRAA